MDIEGILYYLKRNRFSKKALFDNIPAVKDNFTYVIFGIIFVSLLPAVITAINVKREKTTTVISSINTRREKTLLERDEMLK